MPVQVRVPRKNKRKRFVSFIFHPLTVAGAILLARLGLDLFAEISLERHGRNKGEKSKKEEK